MISAQIVDGNISLKTLLEGKKIRELNWSNVEFSSDPDKFIGTFSKTVDYIHAIGGL
ncbi:hypothetical protein [Bacteroidetes bacterium endosymbiont of Geopemphigus sp.]|uniref:hypothetical protein n=1 Tax=Bacteroidetes bacterium endosymbiont of Geopemphigus sp. TaxID=2047937 RepID=UPI0018A81BB2|nr:hypothetical protein [Bacteroidetes bacterium endosymbiont of Geopemphigus sp.]